MNAIAPIPKVPVSVREATSADVAFIDRLQKMHSDRVGFMRESWIEAKINAGQVLVAEETTQNAERKTQNEEGEDGASAPFCVPRSAFCVSPVGYCMGVDRYFKRDDVGIIHQLNVVPGRQRGFVGATLLKAMFDRAAYGCRLFCCWCAQDLEANRFWEAMGFVPLAYRAGSEKKARVHIFWQKRIRSGDCETPWWFPAKTDGGVIREDRIVLPIPPGKHWSDEMPVLRPAQGAQAAMTDQRAAKARVPKGAASADGSRKVRPRQFDGPPAGPEPEPVMEKPKQGGREKKPKAKADPKLVAVARELRDRWLEQVNSGAYVFEDAGKYDVARVLPRSSVALPGALRALPDAA